MNMKPYFILILMCVFSFNNFLLGQDWNDIENKIEAGKIFVTCSLDEKNKTNKKDSFIVLKIMPPEWKIEKVKISQFYKREGTQKYKIVDRESALKFKHTFNLERNCLSRNPKDCIGVLGVELPDKYKIVSTDTLSSDSLVDVKRLKKNSTLEIDLRKFESIVLNKNEDFKIFENKKSGIVYLKMRFGHWSKWRELLCSGPCPNNSVVQLIQERLKVLGYYKGPENNTLTSETKKSIIQFQKDNQLPAGGLNIETLRTLGLKF